MKMPDGYQEASAFSGARKQLPAGGYICRIKGAKECTDKGFWRFDVAFEVDEGTEKGFFTERYQEILEAGKENKWPGVLRVFVLNYNDPKKCSSAFKGLIKSVEESNPGFTMKWEDGSERELMGKQIGIVFREEEFLTQDGQIIVTTKPMYACSTKTIRDGVKTPKRKALKLDGGGAVPADSAAPPPPGDDECPF